MPLRPLLPLLALPVLGLAAPAPLTVAADTRIRHIDYSKDSVILIPVQRGTATRIVLADDERIADNGAATGYTADCAKSELAWCMRADAGGNQVLVRPKSGATSNNLELRTDKRDYSFRFEVLPDATSAAKGNRAPLPAYRVILRYSPPPAMAATAASVAVSATDLLHDARPAPRNWSYSMQILPGSDDIAPAVVFDDGRFTYLQFPANRELPTIYAVGAGGGEARVNFHMDQHDPGLLVVERMARQFVLRLGGAVIGIWNEAYDSYGAAPADGTTVEGVARTFKRAEP